MRRLITIPFTLILLVSGNAQNSSVAGGIDGKINWLSIQGQVNSKSKIPTEAVIQAQSKTAPSKEQRTKNDLMELEREIGKANIERDYAFFDRIEAEEFIFTDAGGGITTKQQDLAGLKTPPNANAKLTAYDVDEMQVSLYDKTAVVTGRVTTTRLVNGKEVKILSRFTDVFVWRQKRWQMVAGHSSRIRQP